jgi:DNA-binding NtrC family response regulator
LAENASQARDLHQAKRHDLILLDIWMPDTDGVTLLKEWAAQQQLSAPVIMMSGHATIETAVEATRIGATDFLEKPIALNKLLQTVQLALSRKPVRAESFAKSSQGFGQDNETEYEWQDTSAGLSGLEPELAPQPVAARSALEIAKDALMAINLAAPLREARDDFERAYLNYHLEQERGSMTRVAESTGLERTHLYRKLKQLGIDKR